MGTAVAVIIELLTKIQTGMLQFYRTIGVRQLFLGPHM
jgi:hypothetical protein